MNPEQIRLIQESFEKIRPVAQQAGQIFYARLFETAPALRPMFKGNMDDQARTLMHVLATAVASAHRLDALLPSLQDMGRRHAGYGVRDEHYPVVGSALLWTLEQGLGEAFHPEVKAAWAVLYNTVADAMRKGAAETLVAAA